MKNKINIFLVLALFFNVAKADINIVKVFEEEKKYFKKEQKQVLDGLEKTFIAIFESYDNASDDEKKLDFSIDTHFITTANYSFKYGKYKHQILVGVEYKNIKILSNQEKSQLIEYAKNAMKDLLDKEVFGMRAISEDITVYFMINKIEKITE